jgi:flagellar motor protein MotB
MTAPVRGGGTGKLTAACFGEEQLLNRDNPEAAENRRVRSSISDAYVQSECAE